MANMDAGDSRKLGSFSGSTLTKKSMNFLRDAYSLAQTTFTERPDGQQHQQHQQPQPGLSQHFGHNSTSNYPSTVANPYLQPSAALSPHQPQQWPRPPTSPNRPQTQGSPPYFQNAIPHRPHQVSNQYIPGQGMVSQPWGHDGHVPQRHNSNASTDAYATLPPPPPYAPPQHSPSPPLPPAQQYPSQPVTPDPQWHSAAPRPSASPQPEQQGQWSHQQQHEPHQQMPAQQSTYQAFAAPQQAQPGHPVPQRHQTLPAGQYRPLQYQPHHSNSYPSSGLGHRPSISKAESSPAPPLPDRPTPPLPQRPQWQAQQPPAGYAELPSPPQQQQQPQQQHPPAPSHSYFPPPSGVAEMYAPPPPPPPSLAPAGYAELPAHEPSVNQQPPQPAYQAYHGDSKPPVHQYSNQHGGHNVPHMAELPG